MHFAPETVELPIHELVVPGELSRLRKVGIQFLVGVIGVYRA